MYTQDYAAMAPPAVVAALQKRMSQQQRAVPFQFGSPPPFGNNPYALGYLNKPIHTDGGYSWARRSFGQPMNAVVLSSLLGRLGLGQMGAI